MGDRPEARSAARDCFRRGWCLHDLFTGTARELRPDMPHDFVSDRFDIQNLIGIFAETVQFAAT